MHARARAAKSRADTIVMPAMLGIAGAAVFAVSANDHLCRCSIVADIAEGH
jgi:hypothetical protein